MKPNPLVIVYQKDCRDYHTNMKSEEYENVFFGGGFSFHLAEYSVLVFVEVSFGKNE
jgi:hypothetical protein